MREFSQGKIEILVATTVIEVGIDVTNATVMLVEQAERFGLAQLHQLRGRVGRGTEQSYCVFAHTQQPSIQAKARLDVLSETSDGFEIAERDLELRGPGDFFGTRQSGVPAFTVGDLTRDHRIMDEARDAAIAWLMEGSESDERLNAIRTIWTTRYGSVGLG